MRHTLFGIVALVVLGSGIAFAAQQQPPQPSQAVYVTGEVKKAGYVDYVPGLTVEQAIELVGGGTEDLSIGRSTIVRQVKDADGKVIRTATIKQLRPETKLLPGDTLRAGKKWKFDAVGTKETQRWQR